MRIKIAWTKLSQWEHWPTFMFYVPLIPYYLWKAIKAGNPVYYLATNPGILYSGNGSESKFKTLALIPDNFKPKSILILKETSFKSVVAALAKKGLQYPIIAKPDIGFRGYLVKKIESEAALNKYFNCIETNIILQEFISYENEIGVFYHKIPGEEKGKITSITLKKYSTIIGDGKNTLHHLILNDERAFLYYNLMKSIHQKDMHKVVPKNKKVVLSVIGNHSKGTEFINGNQLINNALENTFQTICNDIKGWNYGRIDLKYNSIEELEKGKNFTIIEINGIISEPTHIYDPSNGASYFDALKSIKKHWEIMDTIALKNHRNFGVPYPKLKPYLLNMLALRKHAKMLKKLNKI